MLSLFRDENEAEGAWFVLPFCFDLVLFFRFFSMVFLLPVYCPGFSELSLLERQIATSAAAIAAVTKGYYSCTTSSIVMIPCFSFALFPLYPFSV